MKVIELEPIPSVRIQFKHSYYKNVPNISGCYALTNYENDILYIGLSDNLQNRFLQHLDNPDKTSTTENGKVIWFHFLEYDIINLPRLERTWLNKYEAFHGNKPILNKYNSPVK